MGRATRILHASDWHLGKTLEGRSRLPEQEAYLDEVVRLAADVDLVLIAGDVFDVYNPPIDAEQLYFETLARLGERGRRHVVVIAGNHDSPDRIAASAPLAALHGVHVVGRPTDAPVELDLPGGRVVVAALPYPSEARLRTLLSQALKEDALQAAYSTKVAAVLAELATHFDPGATNVVMSHLQVRACLQSESERALIGGAYQVDASIFPASADYVALGHLHRAQDVPAGLTAVRYCGAPLPYRFSERDVERTHTIVEVGSTTTVHTVPIDAGRDLVVWEAGSFAEVLAGVEDGWHADAFIDLGIHLDRPLTHDQLAILRRLPRDFVRLRALLPAAEDRTPRDQRLDLAPAELFTAFYRDQTGSDPDSGIVDLFLELATDVLEAGEG
ncbi:MAG: exonuclease subunit SbcD [Myxococcales bacterium]|nr:exonuclease subunit SbcD [Myxococcales bacterium]MCB9694042.1 exonuclease subunit SbcD [Alphaproteobacteria bacterium]